MSLRALTSALALAATLAGCLSPDGGPFWGASFHGEAVEGEPWTPGSWWGYHATFRNGRSIDVALVVHETGSSGYRLGTNLTAGFFGLPFAGNVTPGFNPIVAGEEWRLYEFPLYSGQSWEQHLFGHNVVTRVSATTLEAPGLPAHPGFALETTAYGRTFARYTWSPATGWFTHLVLIEPTDGVTVLDARLTGFGGAFGEGYYVETPVTYLRREYPAAAGAPGLPLPRGLPLGPEELRLPSDGRLTAVLRLAGEAGGFSARLLSPRGGVLLEASVLASGVAIDRDTFTATAGAYRLEHAGAGTGELRLEITALLPAGNDPPPADTGPVPRIDPAALLR